MLQRKSDAIALPCFVHASDWRPLVLSVPRTGSPRYSLDKLLATSNVEQCWHLGLVACCTV